MYVTIYNMLNNNNKTMNKTINVNKCEGRGGVTEEKWTVGEVIQEMVDNWFFEEETLTGGVELEKGVCSIGIHEELQYEFNIADLEGKYFSGHVDDEFSEITREGFYEALKEKEYDTSWEITDEGILKYMYYDGYILVYVYTQGDRERIT